MIYKLEDGNSGNVLECCVNKERGGVYFSINNSNTKDSYDNMDIMLNDEQLFQLIGALHIIQKHSKTTK